MTRVTDYLVAFFHFISHVSLAAYPENFASFFLSYISNSPILNVTEDLEIDTFQDNVFESQRNQDNHMITKTQNYDLRVEGSYLVKKMNVS